MNKERDTSDARRFVYRLTEKGIDLAPVLVELVLWCPHRHHARAGRAIESLSAA